jgi:hypothetical protein
MMGNRHPRSISLNFFRLTASGAAAAALAGLSGTPLAACGRLISDLFRRPTPGNSVGAIVSADLNGLVLTVE